MSFEHPLHSFRDRSVRALLMALGMGFLAGSPVLAATAKSPAAPVPGGSSVPQAERRWDDSSSLRPAAILGDTTRFVGHDDPKAGDTLLYYSLDVESGYVFTATGQGFQVFDARNGIPGEAASYIYGWITGGAFPDWDYSDKDWYIKNIDVPAGNPNVAVLGMEEQGFAIVNTENKRQAVVSYQGKIGTESVYAFTSGGTVWAYAVSGGNVFRFNVTTGSRLVRCLEETPSTNSGLCPGVYQGQVSAFGSGIVSLSGAGSFVATGTNGRTTGSVKFWNVSNPAAPVQVGSIAGASPSIALWQQGSSYYLARLEFVSNKQQLAIYNVSCMASGNCSNPPLLWSGMVPAPQALSQVSVSTDAGRSYVYLGGEDVSSCAAQREYIFDVTSPNSPNEITPKIHAGGYWGWYYMTCSTGFNLVGPRVAKVQGGYLYRAAVNLFDAHQIRDTQPAPPTASFTFSPSTDIYAGVTQVQFNDTSVGNPAPTARSWTFPDGTPDNPSAANPKVTFGTPGSKQVTLVSQNANGPSAPVSQSVVVLDPAPQVTAITGDQNVMICEKTTLTAAATGAPTLNVSWAVTGPGGTPAPNGTGSGKVFEWQTTGAMAPGVYTATATATNQLGNASRPVSITVTPLVDLPGQSQFAPTVVSKSGGTVKFNVAASGATEYSWDFEGNNVFGPWTTDASPTYAYQTTGNRQVKVRVRNCTTPDQVSGILSSAVSVDIDEITPLKAQFTINGLCSGGLCFVSTNEKVTFTDQSTGAAIWNFDWNGDGDYADAGEGDLSASDFKANKTIEHTFTTPGTFTPKLKVRRNATSTDQQVFSLPQQIVVSNSNPPPPGGITVAGPATGSPNQGLSFTAQGTGSCSPNANGWTWNAAGGSVTGAGTSSVTITWTSEGNKTITVTNSACSGVTGTRSVSIGSTPPPPPTGLKAAFVYAPTTAAPNQAILFDGSSSTGGPTGWVWDFGDGTPFAVGTQVSHTFAKAGAYTVSLSVTGPGNCPPAPFCENTLKKTVVVTGPVENPGPVAAFASEICVANLNFVICTTDANKEVTFADTSTGNVVSRSWSFGDGATGSGTPVKHTYKTAGVYALTLTVSDGAKSSTITRNIVVNPGAGPKTEAMVLPWIAKTVDGALVQSSDLYLHNPGESEIEVTLEFRRRGLPENNPRQEKRTIAPNATLFVGDIVKTMFDREDISGFIAMTVDKGDIQPVLTSFNTTFANDGSEFGQTVPGFAVSNTGASSSTGNTQIQHLVGLNDNGERLAYFGLSNPSDEPVSYRLRFFDHNGQPVGRASEVLTMSRNGFKQFQVRDIRTQFGINDQDDYRVVIESTKGAPLFPFAANLRVGSNDPSFVAVGTGAQRVFLVGALSTAGLNGSLWQSDLVIANTSDQVVISEITFTGAGAATAPTDTLSVTLQPGETRRLSNLIDEEWGIRNGVGVLTVESDAPNSLFPVVQGESYETTIPSKRYGQTIPALTESQAAGPNQGHYLVGLRQDAKYRTTFWLFNPGTESATYDVIYRSLAGNELGRVAVSLGAGKMRQFSPGQHPLPAAGVEGGFTVQVLVKTGKVLASGQVVNKTNDPAYIQGERR